MKKKKPVRVGVFGAGGRMGQEIAKLLKESKSLEGFLGVDPSGEAEGFSRVAKSLKDSACADVQVWIDFSQVEAFDSILDHCVKTKTALVSGTTGLSAPQKKKLEKSAKKTAILWSSNMSLGVAVLSEAMRVFSRLEGFDFQIEEFHHRRKKDKPSGTALTLQEVLVDTVKIPVPEPLAIRGGGVFGVHKVWAFSEEETLMFEHQALNRAVFARGALAAAEWMSNKPAGLYKIRDLLFGNQRERQG